MEQAEATDRFYEMVWPHRALVLRAAMIQTGNAADAEDLAQDTLLKAFRAIETYRAGSNAGAWLMTILRNTRIDRMRTASGSARHVSLEEVVVEQAVDVEEPGDLDEAWKTPADLLNRFSDAQVIEALKGIAEELRWTLLLVDVEGMEQSDAATVLEVPVGTIKSRLHRGRAMLRQALLPLAREMRLIS